MAIFLKKSLHQFLILKFEKIFKKMFLQSCRRRRCHLNDVERWNEIENIFIL